MIAQVDLLNANQAQGEVANRLMEEGMMNVGLMRPFMYKNPKTGQMGVYATVETGKDPNTGLASYKTIPLTTNATLRRDEWKLLDDAIIRISEKELIGIGDLRNNGLTYSLGNAFGTTQLEWHQMSDALEASIDMDAEVRGQGDRIQYRYNYLPIPIVYVDYSLSKRTLEASRKMGNPLDTSMAERATRKVNEKLENMLFQDQTYSFGAKDENNRNAIYSYINHPDRNQVTLASYGNWDDSSTSHDQIKKSVLAMKQAARDQYFTGPFVLYVPGNYETALEEDYNYSTSSQLNVRQKLEQINGIQKVQVIDSLPDDNILLVQMTSDVVRLVDGMPIQNIEWMVNGGFTGKFKVMTIQVPQIRSDYDGKCGIVHMA